jgi:uncharacterized oxidoreductase
MRFRPDILRSFATDLLCALGTPPDSSSKVATSLIQADLRGTGSHGVSILPLYAEMVADQAIDPSAEPAIERSSACIINVNGRLAFGQLTGETATATGIETADKHGVAVVGIRNGAHLGRLGEWAEQATGKGMVFMAFANAGGGARNVAPFGGHERKLSTNPVAFGVPTFGALPFNVIADFATSQVSGAVIREHYRAGLPLNDEWTTTATGDPVATAEAFMDDEGALLPLGGRTTGHKGYGLSVIAELIGGYVGGMVVGQQDPEWFSNAAMFVLVDPTRFLSVEQIQERATAVAEHLRDETVRLPGEGAYQREITAREQGLAIPDHVVASLARLASDLNVETPAEFADGMSASSDGHKSLKSW